jgi:phosphatidylglycerophosphate synthase
MAALGVFIYQTLDAIDGKQARRTRSNNSLGEIFDHGCDAISTLLVVLAGCSAGAINEFPYVTLTFVLLIEFTNYVYHWQTYVSGCLYFKTVDCTEGQVCHMTVMVLSFLFGTNTWEFQLPVVGIPFKFLIASGVIFFSITNIISSFIIIFTRGVGKNGATVADTSVVSPFIPPAIIIACSIYYSLFSPSMILQNHVMLLCSSMIMPFVKLILLMMMSGICASPLPLIDIVMIGPIIAVVNLLLGCLVPEYYVLIFITIFNVYDLVSYCVSVVNEVCNYLDVHCFTIPYPPPPSVTSSSTTPTNKH